VPGQDGSPTPKERKVNSTPTIKWPGKSGKTYQYWIYPLPPNFSSEPGNYIFAKQTSPGKWTPVYIGQTDDLSERFDDHHKMPCIKSHGATHIHAHKNTNGETTRKAEEADLIARWNPPCNG
jgi:hypothetical protein